MNINGFFKNGQKHVIWKRSQHLHQWKQRQLQFINNQKIATAKEQSVDGWNASFNIDIKQVTKLAIYPPDYIHNHFMVMIKVNYGKRHTYMADKDWVAFELFMAIIRNKCITSLQKDKLEKHQIAGNKLIHYGNQRIVDRFVVFRKAGLISKDWVKQQMIITDRRLVTYSKMGFGEQANEKGDWHIQITQIKRIKTQFQFWKDCLVIKIYTSTLSSDEFAVPIQGQQIKALCRTVADHKKE